MSRIIAVNSNCYHGYSIEDAIVGTHKAGFQFIELTATKGWTEHVFPTQSFSYLTHVKKLLRENRLTPFSMSGHCNLMDAERLPDFINNMDLAEFFGCNYIISSIGEAHLQDRAKLPSSEVVKNICELVPYLEERGLTLALETHGKEYGTGKELKKIVEMVNSERVRINYDTANVLYYGNTDIAEDLESCLDLVSYMHIKDKAGTNSEWNFPPLGCGRIDFPAIFQMLNDKKNNCPLSVEIEFTPKGPGNIESVHAAVRESYCYLKTLGFF